MEVKTGWPNPLLDLCHYCLYATAAVFLAPGHDTVDGYAPVAITKKNSTTNATSAGKEGG